MASYDPTATILNWNSIIIQGVMDGEFVTAEHRNPDVELHVGAQGFATFVENADKSGMIKVILSQKSPTNGLLSAAFRSKVAGMFLMTENDLVTTRVVGADARIEKHAPIKRGKTIVGMEWTWLVPNLQLFAGGDAP